MWCKVLGDILFVHAERFFLLNIACTYCSFKLHTLILYLLFQNWSTCWNILSYNVFTTVIKGMTLFQCCLCLHKTKISRCSIETSQHVEDCGTLLRTVLFSISSLKKAVCETGIVHTIKFKCFYNL